MTTNDCIKKIHAAIVAKAKSRCEVDGNNKFALEVSGQVGEYASLWATAFGNDGRLDDDEERAINAKFDYVVDRYLPSKEGTIVDKAWNGIRFCFINVFDGVRNYLNRWFGLEVD